MSNSNRLGPNTLRLLNEQITHEMSSAYLYLAMSIYCSTKSLNGCAKWLYLQYKEEELHAQRIIDFLCDVGFEPSLLAIPQPASSWPSLRDLFAEVLSHEKEVTALICDIKESAIQEKDHISSNFIEWFINEQVEEEATAQYILDKISMVGDEPSSLLIIDKELADRKE